MNERFGFAPDLDNPGWLLRPATPTGRFADIFGTVAVRVDPPATARIRVTPDMSHSNIQDTVHGGFILALIDQALFVGPAALGIERAMMGVTIDTSTQFLAPLHIDRPVDVTVEVLRETGRMIFMRGLIEQAGVVSVSFTGTTRKASA